MGDLKVADQTLAHFFGIGNVNAANWAFPTSITSAYDSVIDNTKRYADRFVAEADKVQTQISKDAGALGTKISKEADKMQTQFSKEADKMQT